MSQGGGGKCSFCADPKCKIRCAAEVADLVDALGLDTYAFIHIPTDTYTFFYREIVNKDELVNKFKLEPKFILPTTVASKPENIGKNRWPEFLAYDDTRVKLNVSTGSDYINANYVNMPIGQDEQKWICTQAPLESTIDAFFTRVVQNLVIKLVLLAKSLLSF